MAALSSSLLQLCVVIGLVVKSVEPYLAELHQLTVNVLKGFIVIYYRYVTEQFGQESLHKKIESSRTRVRKIDGYNLQE